MAEYLLIDGYNVINAWPELKELAQNDLEESRNLLIQKLVDYKHFTGQKMILVFDAHQVKGPSNRMDQIKGIEIVYSKERQTADSYIEIKVAELLKNRRNKVKVATSDGAEQQAILGSGGTRVSARELILEINETQKRIQKNITHKNKNRNVLIDRVDEETALKLEKWRRDGNIT